MITNIVFLKELAPVIHLFPFLSSLSWCCTHQLLNVIVNAMYSSYCTLYEGKNKKIHEAVSGKCYTLVS